LKKNLIEKKKQNQKKKKEEEKEKGGKAATAQTRDVKGRFPRQTFFGKKRAGGKKKERGALFSRNEWARVSANH